MTNWTEPGATTARAAGMPLGPAWRAERERAQEAAFPDGSFVISCDAPYGAAGLGRHLEEIADALARRGRATTCICKSSPKLPISPTAPRQLSARVQLAAVRPFRRALTPGRKMWRHKLSFDLEAARRLPAADHLITFNRASLAQYRAARGLGYSSVSMMSASSHVEQVARQNAKAQRQYPLERSFGTLASRRYLAEYAEADRIYVASRYSWESFSARGVDDDRLALMPMTPSARFQPASARGEVATFNVVFIGRLCVAKGVPLLVDAIKRLAHSDMRLVLVGGWSSRGMRRYLEKACAEDPRISIAPGDPLPHLQQAGLCAHPTYEDGFAYAPAEAMACGVPVLVSEDTGMKDLIDHGVDGLILPTGDLSALTESIDAVYRGDSLR